MSAALRKLADELKAHFSNVPRRKMLRDRASQDAEVLDPTPMEVTIERPLTMREEMQRYIREEVSRYAEAQMAYSTFEEEDDFDEDDPEADFTTPYTVQDMHDVAPAGEFSESVEGPPTAEVPPQPESGQVTEPPGTADDGSKQAAAGASES